MLNGIYKTVVLGHPHAHVVCIYPMYNANEAQNYISLKVWLIDCSVDTNEPKHYDSSSIHIWQVINTGVVILCLFYVSCADTIREHEILEHWGLSEYLKLRQIMKGKLKTLKLKGYDVQQFRGTIHWYPLIFLYFKKCFNKNCYDI